MKRYNSNVLGDDRASFGTLESFNKLIIDSESISNSIDRCFLARPKTATSRKEKVLPSINELTKTKTKTKTNFSNNSESDSYADYELKNSLANKIALSCGGKSIESSQKGSPTTYDATSDVSDDSDGDMAELMRGFVAPKISQKKLKKQSNKLNESTKDRKFKLQNKNGSGKECGVGLKSSAASGPSPAKQFLADHDNDESDDPLSSDDEGEWSHSLGDGPSCSSASSPPKR